MYEVAIIIPAYNEEQCIRQVMLDFHQQLPYAFLCVVDNNSNDSTQKIAQDTLAGLNCSGVVMYEPRQGKSLAVKKAFKEVDAACYLMVDADMTYPPEAAKELVDSVLSGACDMAVGDRHSSGSYKAENSRKFHGFGNSLVAGLINRLFGYTIHDAMSGYRAFSKKFVLLYPIKRSGFELETEMTIHAASHNWRITEIPINFKERPNGSVSKLNTFKDGLRVLKLIIRMYKDFYPLRFFFIAAVFTAILSLLCGYFPVKQYLLTDHISRLPLAILAASLAGISIIIFAVGIILDTCKSYYYSNYELLSNLCMKSDDSTMSASSHCYGENKN